MKGFLFLCGLLAVLCLLAIPLTATAGDFANAKIEAIEISQVETIAQPADYFVQCAANANCSTARATRSRRWQSVSTVQVTETKTVAAYSAARSGPARGAVRAAGGRAVSASAAAGGAAVKVVTAPVRWFRNRGGRAGCG
jgi:hypothetical protein